MFKTLSSSNKSEQNTTNPSLLCALLALPSSPSFLKVPCLHYLYFLTSLIPNSARSAFHLTTPLKLLFQELPHLRSEVWKCGGTGLYCWPLHPQGWLTAGTKYTITAFSGAFILLITFELSPPFHPITRFL